jgi:hypothetical protein
MEQEEKDELKDFNSAINHFLKFGSAVIEYLPELNMGTAEYVMNDLISKTMIQKWPSNNDIGFVIHTTGFCKEFIRYHRSKKDSMKTDCV